MLIQSNDTTRTKHHTLYIRQCAHVFELMLAKAKAKAQAAAEEAKAVEGGGTYVLNHVVDRYIDTGHGKRNL